MLLLFISLWFYPYQQCTEIEKKIHDFEVFGYSHFMKKGTKIKYALLNLNVMLKINDMKH